MVVQGQTCPAAWYNTSKGRRLRGGRQLLPSNCFPIGKAKEELPHLSAPPVASKMEMASFAL